MDRVKIKEKAKELVKGNKWNIWWPLLVISFLEGACTKIIIPSLPAEGKLEEIELFLEKTVENPVFYASSTLVTIVIGILMGGYLKYLLDYVRKGKFDSDSIINAVKEKWIELLIANILTTIIITAAAVLLIIPGIIMAFAYAFVNYIVIDTKTKGNDALKESREMMKGHKFEYFVFELSFIGWVLLTPFTLGILLIWLVPYMMIAHVLFYEELKKLKSK